VLRTLRAAASVFVAITIVTGVAYPFVITLVSLVAFHHQANGSLIERDDKIVGSALIGQHFTSPRYFWSRPSAAGYDRAASTGSNLGPTNPAQLETVKQRVADLKAAHGNDTTPVPIDLITASGSGLDPHISPAAAAYQIPRVAKARGMAEIAVQKHVAAHTDSRTFGVLGEPRVNVLQLNLSLDVADAAQPPAEASDSNAASLELPAVSREAEAVEQMIE
jgi:K+-transporting ATPase ATPase C chain